MAETVEGYLIDLGCIGSSPREEIAKSAREHKTACALEESCIESGFGLVDNEGNLTVLDAYATPLIVKQLRESDQEQGVVVRVKRELIDGKMQTTGVQVM
jgi:hypothetical protein